MTQLGVKRLQWGWPVEYRGIQWGLINSPPHCNKNGPILPQLSNGPKGCRAMSRLYVKFISTSRRILLEAFPVPSPLLTPSRELYASREWPSSGHGEVASEVILGMRASR